MTKRLAPVVLAVVPAAGLTAQRGAPSLLAERAVITGGRSFLLRVRGRDE